jgi:sec-independent protein translocase protein TatC
MTFGEHLEELRKSLGMALLWLAAGLVIGLVFFADRVVKYVQDPLKAAIQQFNADRDLARLGVDPDSPDIQALRRLLIENGLHWELVYDVPEELLAQSGLQGDESLVAAGPVQMVELLAKIPEPSQLKPRLQLRRHEIGLTSLKVEEPFMIWVKAGLIVGAVLASPMIFYHLWSFVAAGLHSHERRYVYIYLPFSVALFVSGVSLAFYFVLRFVLSFLLQFNGQLDVAVEPRLTYYINFVLLLPLGFGIAFQLPLVMLFLERIGLISVQGFIGSWRIAILVIAFISMMVTPADITSMISLMVPLIFLYFLGVLLCMYMPKGRGLGSDAYDPR